MASIAKAGAESPLSRHTTQALTLDSDAGRTEREGWISYANELWMKKKEEFPGFTKTCCLGTPFPRSALFLKTSCGNLRTCTRVLRGYDLK
jgi:hypothetical protein